MLACVAGAKKGREGEREKSAKVQKDIASSAGWNRTQSWKDLQCQAVGCLSLVRRGGHFPGGKRYKGIALPGGHFNRFPESVQTSGYFQFSSAWGCLPDVISKHAWRGIPVYELWLRQDSPNLLSSYHQPTQCLTPQKKKKRSCELKIDGKLGHRKLRHAVIG